jgi:hypothetical protein
MIGNPPPFLVDDPVKFTRKVVAVYTQPLDCSVKPTAVPGRLQNLSKNRVGSGGPKWTQADTGPGETRGILEP